MKRELEKAAADYGDHSVVPALLSKPIKGAKPVHIELHTFGLGRAKNAF